MAYHNQTSYGFVLGIPPDVVYFFTLYSPCCLLCMYTADRAFKGVTFIYHCCQQLYHLEPRSVDIFHMELPF